MSNSRHSRQFEFGPFRLDPVERVLLREGLPVALAPKALEMLLVLVRHRGHLVEKSALIQAVWPDTFVEEGNLSFNISVLRKTLGEAQEGRPYIETVPRRGYRFSAEASAGSDGLIIVRQRTKARIVIRESESHDDASSAHVAEPDSRAAGGLELRAVLRSVAVLPFRSLGSVEEDDHPGLAMADALITRLCNMKQVVVRPTSAVRMYTGREHDLATTARELMVESVLEGNIQKSREQTRVTVQLIAARDGATLWAHQFDGRSTDIFALQDAIAEQVIHALKLKLSTEEIRRTRKRHTTSVEAYEAYTKGRFFWDKRSEYGCRKAIEFFRKAIALDPRYALAYTGLADTFIIQGFYDLSPPRETFLEAKKAALKALELDPLLGEAHTSVAAIELFCDWNFARAEAGFLRAIDLSPNHVIAHLGYADLLSATGRHEEAIAEIRYAQSLDPLNLGLLMNVGDHLCFARRYDEAVEQYRKTLEMEPRFVRAYLRLALTYMRLGQPDAADAMLRSAKELAGGKEEPLAWFAHVYAASRQKAQASRILDQLRLQAQHDYVPAYVLAGIHAALGETDAALDCLNQALEDRSSWAIFIAVDPALETLRNEAGFTQLLQRLNAVSQPPRAIAYRARLR